MSDIPGARAKLRAIAKKLRAIDKELAGEVLDAVDDMHRAKPVRRMPAKANPVTPRVKAKIIEMAETTDMHSSEIAHELGINPGRVSEVLHGGH